MQVHLNLSYVDLLSNVNACRPARTCISSVCSTREICRLLQQHRGWLKWCVRGGLDTCENPPQNSDVVGSRGYAETGVRRSWFVAGLSLLSSPSTAPGSGVFCKTSQDINRTIRNTRPRPRPSTKKTCSNLPHGTLGVSGTPWLYFPSCGPWH